jgi:hypothetical protein
MAPLAQIRSSQIRTARRKVLNNNPGSLAPIGGVSYGPSEPSEPPGG